MTLNTMLYEYMNENDNVMLGSVFRDKIEQRYIELEGEAQNTVKENIKDILWDTWESLHYTMRWLCR